MTGELFLSPSAAGRSGINLGVGSLPSVPSPGDFPATSGAVWWQSSTAGQLLPVIIGGAPPTATGTCAIGSQLGTNAVGSFIATGACSSQTVILTFANTAPHGWNCDAHDLTTPTDSLKPTAYTTASITLTGTIAASDLVTFSCTAF
jgi:hypothetical protein